MDELITLFKELRDRIELLERLIALEKIVIPPEGKLVVDLQSSDPPAQKGRIYFNTTLNKFRVSEDGLTWKTIDTV